MSKLMLSLLLILPGVNTIDANWHERKAEGWAWYEEGQKTEKKETTSPITKTDEMQKIRQDLENKLVQAVLDPTPENIRSYMEEQQKWLERASLFAKVWASTLLNHPHLDYTATHTPISQYGLQFYKNAAQEKKENLIATLSKEYGLFFFYEGKNEISSVFGHIVREFSTKYGYQTIAISLDDIKVEGFTNHKKDNGIGKSLSVDVTPALYLIHPQTNLAIPIAFGLVAMDKIEDNIALQFRELLENE